MQNIEIFYAFKKTYDTLTMFVFFQLTIEFKVFSIFNVKTEKLFLNNITKMH